MSTVIVHGGAMGFARARLATADTPSCRSYSDGSATMAPCSTARVHRCGWIFSASTTSLARMWVAIDQPTI